MSSLCHWPSYSAAPDRLTAGHQAGCRVRPSGDRSADRSIWSVSETSIIWSGWRDSNPRPLRPELRARVVDGGCLRTSRAAEGRYGTVLVSLVAVFRSCTADVVRWSKLASSTSGSEWQCFVQFWSPWGVGRVPKAFPKVQSVIGLGEEVR